LIFGEFSFLSSLYILVISSFVWCIASKSFLPLCVWSLQFRDHFFCCADFLIPCSLICILKKLAENGCTGGYIVTFAHACANIYIYIYTSTGVLGADYEKPMRTWLKHSYVNLPQTKLVWPQPQKWCKGKILHGCFS
jgi:hypothetical protein